MLSKKHWEAPAVQNGSQRASQLVGRECAWLPPKLAFVNKAWRVRGQVQ